jgi:Rha family phage regulatory protein
MNDLSPNVSLRDGAVVANSRDIAAFFDKNHRDILRDIDNLLKSLAAQNCAAGFDGMFTLRNEFHEGANREVRSFDLTKDGFTLLVMGFTGDKALKFKLRYIEAFNTMEAAVKRLGAPDRETDRFDSSDLSRRVAMVTECRLAFGEAQAQALWKKLGLPLEPDLPVKGRALSGWAAPRWADDPESCLKHLLTWPIDRDQHRTVHELILRAGYDVDGPDGQSHSVLRHLGLILGPKGWDGWLAVSDSLGPLLNVFGGSPWMDNWSRTLAQLPGARLSPAPLDFGGFKTPAVLLPAKLWAGQMRWHADNVWRSR